MKFSEFATYRETEGLELACMYALALGVKSTQIELWSNTK